jgi:hypothetical protein
METVVLGVRHSYRKLPTLLAGRYLELGLRQHAVTINPFALKPSPEHLHFLHAFVRVLLEGDSGSRVSDLEDREIYELGIRRCCYDYPLTITDVASRYLLACEALSNIPTTAYLKCRPANAQPDPDFR